MSTLKTICVCTVMALSASASQAQTYYDRDGSSVQGVAPIPYPFIALPPGQHGLALTTPIALTIPSGARLATVCASTAAVRYTTDGITTPTATLGQPLMPGSCVSLSGPNLISNFRAMSQGGTLDVEYFH